MIRSRDENISTKKSKAENIWKKSLLQKTVTKRYGLHATLATHIHILIPSSLSPRALLLVKKVMECVRESRAQYEVLLENNKMAAFKVNLKDCEFSACVLSKPATLVDSRVVKRFSFIVQTSLLINQHNVIIIYQE